MPLVNILQTAAVHMHLHSTARFVSLVHFMCSSNLGLLIFFFFSSRKMAVRLPVTVRDMLVLSGGAICLLAVFLGSTRSPLQVPTFLKNYFQHF